jgi:PilZ domain
MGEEEPKHRRQRRSARIVLRIPLFIHLAEGSLDADWEPVETLIVSKYGGLTRTKNCYRVGARIDIRMQRGNRSARARVVWTSALPDSKLHDLGFEIMADPEFWEINFPPDRWTNAPHEGVVSV